MVSKYVWIFFMKIKMYENAHSLALDMLFVWIFGFLLRRHKLLSEIRNRISQEKNQSQFT